MPSRPPTPAASPRRREPPEVRRAQILDGALQVFGTRGYHAATMDELVVACGLSKGSLYWHFDSKEDVFLALFDAFVEESFEAFDEAAEHQSAVEALRSGFHDLLERLTQHGPMMPAWLEFLAHPEARRRFAAVYDQTRAVLADLLHRAAEEGDVRKDLSALGMATALVAAAEGLVLQAVVDPDFDAREHLPVVWDGLLGGFGT